MLWGIIAHCSCHFELSSFDLMPEEFQNLCNVEYSMPLATASHTVVRSVSIEQHEDPERVERYVRYVAKFEQEVCTAQKHSSKVS